MTDTPISDLAKNVIAAVARLPEFSKCRDEAIEALKAPDNIGFAVFIKEAAGGFRMIACCDHAHFAGVSIAATKRAADGY